MGFSREARQFTAHNVKRQTSTARKHRDMFTITSFFKRTGSKNKEKEITNKVVPIDAKHTCDVCDLRFDSQSSLTKHRGATHKLLIATRMRVTSRDQVNTRSLEELKEEIEKAEIQDVLNGMVATVVAKKTGPDPLGQGRRGSRGSNTRTSYSATTRVCSHLTNQISCYRVFYPYTRAGRHTDRL